MKSKILILVLFTVVFSCSSSVEYSETFKKETSGKYLYNPDELIQVYYEGNKLLLNWKDGKIEPVVLAENEFFVPDMYKKFRFVKHPETQKRYLSVIPENEEATITYDFIKLPDSYKTPSTLLKEGDYDKALAGYLEIKKQDSTSSYIDERYFNTMGYRHIRKKEYDKAIGVLKMNTQLHPDSANVYDSLAEAYAKSGDSLQAYEAYKKALDMAPNNKRAQKYVEAYSKNASE